MMIGKSVEHRRVARTSFQLIDFRASRAEPTRLHLPCPILDEPETTADMLLIADKLVHC